MTGTDSVYDHWSPFGRADMLEKPNLYAHLYAAATSSAHPERLRS